jgi:hypothetical protein
MTGRHDPAGRCVGGDESSEKSSAREGSGTLEKGSEDWFFAKGEVCNVWERLNFVVVDPDEVLPCSRDATAPFFFSNDLAEVGKTLLFPLSRACLCMGPESLMTMCLMDVKSRCQCRRFLQGPGRCAAIDTVDRAPSLCRSRMGTADTARFPSRRSCALCTT